MSASLAAFRAHWMETRDLGRVVRVERKDDGTYFAYDESGSPRAWWTADGWQRLVGVVTAAMKT